MMKLIKLFSFIVLFLIASYIIIRICVYYLPYEVKNLAVDASNYAIAGPSLFQNSDFESDEQFWDNPPMITEGSGRMNSRGVILPGRQDIEILNDFFKNIILEQTHNAFVFETWIRTDNLNTSIDVIMTCINYDVKTDWLGREIYGTIGTGYSNYSGSDLWTKVSFALDLPKKTKELHIWVENRSQFGNIYLDEINLYPATQLKN